MSRLIQTYYTPSRNVSAGHARRLPHVLVVPVAHVVEDVLVVVANLAGDVVARTLGLVPIGSEIAVRHTVFIFQDWRVACIGIPRRILTIFAAVRAVFIPDTLIAVLAAVAAIRVPDGFGVVLRGVEVTKEHVVVLATINGKNLRAYGQRKNTKEKGKEKFFHSSKVLVVIYVSL